MPLCILLRHDALSNENVVFLPWITTSMEQNPSSGTSRRSATERFDIVFTRVRQLYLSWATWDQSTSPQATTYSLEAFVSCEKRLLATLCLPDRKQRTGGRCMDFNETMLGIFTPTAYVSKFMIRRSEIKIHISCRHFFTENRAVYEVVTIVLFTWNPARSGRP
jgi:hypothetical protein